MSKKTPYMILGLILVLVIFGVFINYWKMKNVQFIGGKYDASVKIIEGRYIQLNYTKEGVSYSSFLSAKFINSLKWVKANTPNDALFLAWWDYGHMLRGFAEREVIAYAPSNEILWSVSNMSLVSGSFPHKIILDVAVALATTNSSETVDIMKKYGANYIFITKDEQFKSQIIFKIIGKNSSDYITESYEFTDLGKQTMLYKLLNDMTDFRLVYQDKNVKIYSISS